MNEQELTTKALSDLLAWVNSTAELVSEQAPLVCKEMLHWGVVYNASVCAVCFVGAFVSIAISIKVWRAFRSGFDKSEDWFDERNFARCLGTVAALITAIVLFVCTIDALLVIAQIHIAPRVYLISELSALI